MITIWTYDWVPGGEKSPRGFVRDIRLRWACEEAGIDYVVKSTPFENRGPEHFARQPFGQVPYLDDDGIEIFESGACLLHLADKSQKLMPRDPRAKAETLEWVIAALNSIEMVSVPCMFLGFSGKRDDGLSGWLDSRLTHVDGVLKNREWIAAGRFTAADIMLADVLRSTEAARSEKFPNIHAYVARATDRPCFKKARADQIAHFEAGDANR